MVDSMSLLLEWSRKQRDDVTVRRPGIELGNPEVVVFNWSCHRLLAHGTAEECVAQLSRAGRL